LRLFTRDPPLAQPGLTQGIKPETGKNPITGGYGNTGIKPPGTVPKQPGSPAQPSGYGNSATPPPGKSALAGPSQSKMTPIQQQMNRSFSKQESARAYDDYKAQQARFGSSGKCGPQ